MVDGAHVGTWCGWRADGTPLFRATYSALFPGALHGDVETCAVDGTAYQLDRYRHGKHVGSRLLADGNLSREAFVSEHVVYERNVDGAQRFWQAWLEDGVLLVVRTGLVDGVGEETRTEYQLPRAAQEAIQEAREEAAAHGFYDEKEASYARAIASRCEFAEKHTLGGATMEMPADAVERMSAQQAPRADAPAGEKEAINARREQALLALEGAVTEAQLPALLSVALDENNPPTLRDNAFDRVGEGECHGTCDVDFEAPRCDGEAMVMANADCEASCEADLSVDAECTEPRVTVTVAGLESGTRLAALVGGPEL